MALAAVAVVSCGGKVIVDGLAPNGTGGAGGAGQTSSTSSTTSSTHGSTGVAVASSSTGQMTTGTGGSCDPKYTCAEAITPPIGNPQMLCSGSVADIAFQALLKCTC